MTATAKLAELIERLRANNVQRLPIEKELATILGVGRHSVRTAVEAFVASGDLVRQQGRGTFIRDRIEEVVFCGWVGTEPPGDVAVDAIAGVYSDRNPGRKLISRPVPYYDVLQTYISDAIHSTAPDIMQVTPPMIATLHQLGLLQPLGDRANQNNLRRLYHDDLLAGSIGGQILALTWGLSPLILYCNKRVLLQAGLDPESPPKDIAEFHEIAREVNAAGDGRYHGICLPLSIEDPVYQWLYPHLLAHGGGFADQIGNVDILGDSAVHALEYLKRLYRDGSVKGARKVHEGRLLFATDRIAFWVDGPWLRSLLPQLSPIGGEFTDHFFVSTMPRGVDGVSHSVLWNHQLVMSSQCAYPQRAYETMEYIVSDPAALLTYFNTLGMVPARLDLLEQEPYRSDPVVRAVQLQMENVSRFPIDHRLYSRILPFLSQAMSEIIVRDADVSERAERLNDVMHTVANAAFLGFFLH